MIEFVLLDLDDTILDFKWAENQALHGTLTAFGIDPTEEICRRYREINLEYSLEGQTLMLKLQYFGHVIRTANCP